MVRMTEPGCRLTVMLREWRGSIIVRRGRLYVQVRDHRGKWRQRATYLADTPENRLEAQAKIVELKNYFDSLPRPDPGAELAEAQRLGDQARARARSRFKAAIGDSLACESCGWQPRPPLGLRAINIHHLVPTAAGGTDHPENLAALCPNCHAMAHAIFGRKAAPGRAELVEAIRAATRPAST